MDKLLFEAGKLYTELNDDKAKAMLQAVVDTAIDLRDETTLTSVLNAVKKVPSKPTYQIRGEGIVPR